MSKINSNRYTEVVRRLITVELDGETHYLRSITDSEKSQWEADLFDSKGKVSPKGYQSQRSRLLALCLCDEEKAPLFAYSDWPKLANMDAGLSGVLFERAQKECLYADGIPKGVDEFSKKSKTATESDLLSESA